MWCKSCQQDIPAIAAPDGSFVRCAKCHSNVSARAEQADVRASQPTNAETSTATASGDFMPSLDDWELEDDLNEAQRLVDSLGVGSDRDENRRFDLPQPLHRSSRDDTANAPSRRNEKERKSSFFSWCMLSLGLMAFVFGSVLLGWSFATERADLWRLGMPFTLGGQAALIMGLVFQLDGLWRSNRQASETLDELDTQLDELRQATSLLTTTQNNHSQSFYLHMAEGASPKLLLADLKGQLDLLATRMAEDR